MNKYILLAVLALAFTAPSFVFAQDGAPAAERDGKAKRHVMKKMHHKAVRKHHEAKEKAEDAFPLHGHDAPPFRKQPAPPAMEGDK